MFLFSSRRRHTRFDCDWSSDVCSSDLHEVVGDHDGGESEGFAARDQSLQGFRRRRLTAGREIESVSHGSHHTSVQSRASAGGAPAPRRPAARTAGLAGGRRVNALSWRPHPMNFDFTDAERAFAEEIRRFLRANSPETFAVDGMDAGYGSGANSR